MIVAALDTTQVINALLLEMGLQSGMHMGLHLTVGTESRYFMKGSVFQVVLLSTVMEEI